MGFEQILNNAYDKIEKQEALSLEELVKLALTSLMPGTREGNIDQFYELSDMVDLIVFDCEDDKISFVGLLLLLSEIYFDTNDPICKKIRGVLMNRVDSIVEFGKEKYTEGLIEAARNFLSFGLSAEIVSENTALPLKKVKELQKEVKASK